MQYLQAEAHPLELSKLHDETMQLIDGGYREILTLPQ